MRNKNHIILFIMILSVAAMLATKMADKYQYKKELSKV